MTRERVLKLPVLEIFGPTFQGEGRAIGQKTMFVRTAGCDYHCDWCDSAFTWDGSEKPTRMTADEVIAALDKLGNYDYVAMLFMLFEGIPNALFFTQTVDKGKVAFEILGYSAILAYLRHIYQKDRQWNK